MKDLLDEQRRWLARELDQKGRGSRTALAKHLGVRNDAITRMTNLEGQKEEREISFEELILISDFFGSDPPGLANARNRSPSLSQHGNGTVNQPKGVNSVIPNTTLHTVPGEQLMGKIDLPVYSIVQGGRGALVLSSEPFTSIARPHILLGLRDAYGVLVKGNSMAREYSEGDIAYVDPHRHPKEGDPCVFQSHKEDGTVEAVIKYLARSPDASDTLWYVEQTRPVKKFTLKKVDWQICHVAVGKQSGR
jgi:phage repressor protein C with HTH and peptisase S24 domain